MSTAPKKKNFTTFEKKHLIECMLNHKDIIENKKTDGTAIKNKQDAWIKIAAAFNASANINEKATDKQLQRLWSNLKQRQRCELSKERQHRMATGGGDAIGDVEIDPLIEIISPHLLVEIPSINDSDNPQIDKASTSIVDTCLSVPLQNENTQIDIVEEIENRDNSNKDNNYPKRSDTPRKQNLKRFANIRHSSFEEKKSKLIEMEAEIRMKREQMILNFERSLYEAKIETEREKQREAKANADLAVLKLEEYKKMHNK